VSAMECCAPAATATTSIRPATCWGVGWFVRVLFPICPLLFTPNDQTVPSGFRTSEWPEPPARVWPGLGVAKDTTRAQRPARTTAVRIMSDHVLCCHLRPHRSSGHDDSIYVQWSTATHPARCLRERAAGSRQRGTSTARSLYRRDGEASSHIATIWEISVQRPGRRSRISGKGSTERVARVFFR
jgi:hypothetical protein